MIVFRFKEIVKMLIKIKLKMFDGYGRHIVNSLPKLREYSFRFENDHDFSKEVAYIIEE